jgi:hypothetical protein
LAQAEDDASRRAHGLPTQTELSDAVVKRLLDQIADRDHTIKILNRWIVCLIGLFLLLLFTRGGAATPL